MSYQTIFYRKSKIFWMFMIPTSIVTLVCLFFGLPKAFEKYKQVAPRVPIIDLTADQHVTLETKSLDAKTLKALQDSMPGVSVYQVKPELALIGMAKEFIQENGKLLVKVRLFGEHATKVKDQSIFTVRLQAPSLNQLIDHMYNSKEGKALSQQAKDHTKQLASNAEGIWTLFLSKIKSKVSENQFEKIKEDQVIKGILFETFNMEIKRKIDIEQIKKDMLNSKELGEIGDLAISGLDLGKILKTVGKSSLRELGLEAKENVPKSMNEFLDLGKKILICQLVPTSCGNIIISHLNPMDRVKNVAKDVAGEVVSGASQGILNHQDQAISAITQLAKKTNENAQITNKIQDFFTQVFNNEQLKNHLKTQYGEDLSDRLQSSFEEVWQDPSTAKTIDQTVSQMKNLLERSIRLLVLDQNQSGPNPLLLAMIKEKLQRQQEIQINVENNPEIPNQQDVSLGYTFEPKVDDNE